jgi:hypothetical protein
MHMLWVARNSVEVATDLDPRIAYCLDRGGGRVSGVYHEDPG